MEDLTAYASGVAAGGDEAAPHRAYSDAPVAAPVAPREPEEEVGCSSQSAASDSEKLDDSEDEDFTPDSQASSDDEEPLTAESADSGEEDTAAEGDEDIGIYLMDQDLRGQSKTKQLELLLCSLSTMTKTEKSISLYTLLGALMQVPVDRARALHMECFVRGDAQLRGADSPARPRACTLDDEEATDAPLSDHSHSVAKEQRVRKYKKDKTSVSDDHAVIAMDFSQNLTVPSIASTPSQWYFCSLLSVSCFGIFCDNDGIQTNYLYDETASGKGSDQINPMLEHFLRTKVLSEGKNRLTVYAENCSGQNKNNYVIKFLLAQVNMGLLKHVDYKFFVKGHTKNSCDRGFGHIRKHVAKEDCYTVAHVVDAVKEAAANAVTVHIPRGSSQFKTY
ncbi:hypothetical protein F441_22243 [Phytophthora nicotianae CJ01A1]|uniref:DUF7869 domain-containing protein n=1 Tax=Phytophthora nicotianae CJ01A1 TaxID=1317063 RepID=W2VQ75_PHYNI|nr:hypothetical protein F441_22243 [Phytophthora nicotianae CJ01A1]